MVHDFKKLVIQLILHFFYAAMVGARWCHILKFIVWTVSIIIIAFGSWTMRQNPDYYFGIVHAKCNIIVIIMLTVHTMNLKI